MSDTERPRLKPLDAPIDPADPGPLTGSFQVPAVAAFVFEEPLSHDIHIFVNLAAKAAKGLRVYASNNETLKRYLDEAYRALASVLERAEEITLTVREDRFLYGKDVVHANNDREESIPYIFYRNAFRRVALVRGMSREELVQLLTAVVADYGGFDYAGEDLVTALWRIALPHLRYLTIDAMTIDAKSAKSQVEREDIERIQMDIEGIVAQIYKTSATDEDIVAGVSITKEDLEALKEIRHESEEDLDALDIATARAIADINPADIEALNTSLLVESRDSLTTKLLDILIIVAFKEQSAAESVMTMELIQQLFDALLVSQRYVHATHLVKRLRDHAATADNLKEKHIAMHLLRMFATEARVVPLLNNFNDDHKTKSVTEIVEFLRALGAPIVPHMLAALDFLNSPAHRRVICDLILEHGIPDRKLLTARMQGAKWFLARDILHIGAKLPPDQLAPLIDLGLKSEHPKVREYAVGMLRPYARGSADRLVAERLLDEDLEVRLSAIRVAAARRTPDTRAAFEVLIEREDLADREPRELRLLMAAYAAICGSDAIPLLDKILAPSLFGKARMADAQIAAAFALASIGTLAATAALQRGTRTLNTRVREACKKALSGAFEKSPGAELAVPGSTDLPTGASGIAAAKTDPYAAPPMRHNIPPAEGTPVSNRSAKASGISADAPDFNTVAPSVVEEKKKEQHPQFNTGPALGRVHAVHNSREEIPMQILMGTPVESTSSGLHDPSEEPTIAGAALRRREQTPIPLDASALVITRGTPVSAPPHVPPEISLPPAEEEGEILDLELDALPEAAPIMPASRGEEIELDAFDDEAAPAALPAMDPADRDFSEATPSPSVDLQLDTDVFVPAAQPPLPQSAIELDLGSDEDADADAFSEASPEILVRSHDTTPSPPIQRRFEQEEPASMQLDIEVDDFDDEPAPPPPPRTQQPAHPSRDLPPRMQPSSDLPRRAPPPAAPPLDLDLDGFAHPLGSRAPAPMSAGLRPEPTPPPRPLPSFNSPARTREVMPALPDMELPTVVREAPRNQDRVSVPSKRIPNAQSAPLPAQPPPLPPSAPARTKPAAAASSPPPQQRPIPPPATTNPGLTDDLFLDTAPKPRTPSIDLIEIEDIEELDDDEDNGHV